VRRPSWAAHGTIARAIQLLLLCSLNVVSWKNEEHRTDRKKFRDQFSGGQYEESPFVFMEREHISQALTRIDLYRLALGVHGSIVECGSFRGNSLVLWAHLVELFEPHNQTRLVIGFDTFRGFPSVAPEDGGTARPGRLAAAHPERLREMIRLNNIDHRVELVEGDATRTIPAFVKDNPHLVIALLYLDFDIYEPTSVALQHLLPLVPRGGVVGFDELALAKWPGETVAFKRHLSFGEVRLSRFVYHPDVSFFVRD